MQPQKFPSVLIAALTTITLVLTLASTARAAEYKVLYKFQGGADGADPYAGLILDAAGNLYGTTWSGGIGYGTAFKLTPQPDGSWKRTVLHYFNWADGALPAAGLIFDAARNLYGTTVNGGAYGSGTAFKLTPQLDGSWKRSKLHNFNGADGELPFAGLIFDAAGNLYGTTYHGGAYDRGTAFKLTPRPDGSWKRSKLHNFNGADGELPFAGLIFDAAGNLYGTTAGGGAYGYGTAFKLTPQPGGSWKRSKLHNFNGADGQVPYASLIFDAAGNLYGTTSGGGLGPGVVFMITP